MARSLDSLKTVDNNLKTQPKHFCEYIYGFKRDDQSVAQREIGNKIIIAITFHTTFPLFFNSFFSVHTSVLTGQF
jgi:hypothetical protein